MLHPAVVGEGVVGLAVGGVVGLSVVGLRDGPREGDTVGEGVGEVLGDVGDAVGASDTSVRILYNLTRQKDKSILQTSREIYVNSNTSETLDSENVN